MKDKINTKMERETEFSSPHLRKDVKTSNLNNKNISDITEATNFLDIALFYAKYNIKTFPVKKQGKSPLCPNGFKSATTDRGILQEWNKKFKKLIFCLLMIKRLSIM